MPSPWRGWDGSGCLLPEVKARFLRLPGIVEIQEVRLASKQGGRIKEIKVGEGQWVDKDQVLMEFEAPELAARLEQLKAQRDSIQVELEKANKGSRLEEINVAAAAAKAAEEKLKRITQGWRPEEVQQANTDYLAAEADARLAKEELDRADALFRKRMISPSEHDQYTASYERLQNRAATLDTRWKMMKYSKGWELEVNESKALQAQAAANLKLLQVGVVEERRMLNAKMDQKLAEIDEINAQLREATVRAPSAPSSISCPSARAMSSRPTRQWPGFSRWMTFG